MPNWAARYYDRVPGVQQSDEREGRCDSLASEQHDDRARGRGPERARGRKRTSPSPEERIARLQIDGITGLPRAEVAAAVSAVLGQPLHVPAWATKEGSCKVAVPQEALRQAARGEDSLPAPTASGAYVLLRRAQERDPRRDDHRYGYIRRSPSMGIGTSSDNRPPPLRRGSPTRASSRRASGTRDSWRDV